ncbi:MAG: bifunctional diguanylate cyclase/phosphodiesterase [Deltaproteobacteria bacterium]|nr:bifunctional diguanylate cyclase/phosphodiesterase [Deltaproteobacteria bacterium]
MRDARQSRLHPAQHDALTGLAHRGCGHARLEAALARARADRSALALVMLDIERFHALNAALGHAAGDGVLQEVARRLVRETGPRDTVARFGSDEFFILLARLDSATALADADRLVARLTREVDVGGLRIPLRVRAGVALHPDHGSDAVALLRRADLALRQAKEGHSRLAVYESGHEERQLRRLGIVHALRDAVTGGQLALEYQPKLELRSRTIEQTEALLRWRHPALGATAPDEFIPLAEQTGQIEPLTRWVLGQVLQQMRAWRSCGVHVGAAVNLSALDLSAPDLPTAIAGLLGAHGVEAHDLTLEITESALMHQPDVARAGLESLHALGVRLALDDFGVGFSSLSRLRRLPVDELKIDRSFVSGLCVEGRQLRLVRSIVDLGHGLGLRVVAEGVEEIDALRVLEDMGCDAVQGYLVSLPLAPDELARMCRARHGGRRTVLRAGASSAVLGSRAAARP